MILIIFTNIMTNKSKGFVLFGKGDYMSTKRIANMAMLVALAIIFSYVEFLIPINLGIPGIKLGLANLVIVIALYTLECLDYIYIKNSNNWIYVWKWNVHNIQSCGSCCKFDSYDTYEKNQRL